MSESFIAVIAIGIAAILMFVFPLMTMADRSDDITQLTVETATIDFADTVRTTGKITSVAYEKYKEEIAATGNTYDVEIEIQTRDENRGKKSILIGDKIGDDNYTGTYTSQIEAVLNDESKGEYFLKEGDIVLVKAKNTNLTLSQQLKNFAYTVIGDDTYTIAASSGGIVTATGK